MPITLQGIALPDDIQWSDEFAGFGVGQLITPTLTGALIVEEMAQTTGRPITLRSGSGAWVLRSTVEAIAAVAATALGDGETMTLVWHDGTTYAVVFDRSRGPGFSAEEVYRVAPGSQDSEHPYTIEINLLTA